jgi:hypothetical protein
VSVDNRDRPLWALLALAGAVAVTVVGCGGSDRDEQSPPSQPAAGIEAPPVRTPVFGIAEANAWRRVPPPATPDAIARRIAALGATSQRFVVDWSIVEPEPPSDGEHHYRFGPFDAMYDADLRHGIRPLLIVLNAPAWAWDPDAVAGRLVNNPPAASRLADWQAFVSAVARRYPRALGVEVWNEPNLATFWGAGTSGGPIRPDPLRYTQLLRTTYEAVKSADSRLLVIGGALSGHQVGSPAGDIPLQAFARGMLGAGAAAYMDAISLHPYPGSGGVEQTLALIGQVRQARDEIGARMPLWLTELGVTTTGPGAVTEREQARALVVFCRAASRQPDVEALYVHNLIEQTRPGAGFQTGFGLTKGTEDDRLTPKPAFFALRDVLSSPRSCVAAR